MRRGIVIVAIMLTITTALAITWIWISFDENIKQESKLLKLGCEPKARNSWGTVTVWNCPAKLDIDVNKPETFMNK